MYYEKIFLKENVEFLKETGKAGNFWPVPSVQRDFGGNFGVGRNLREASTGGNEILAIKKTKTMLIISTQLSKVSRRALLAGTGIALLSRPSPKRASVCSPSAPPL